MRRQRTSVCVDGAVPARVVEAVVAPRLSQVTGKCPPTVGGVIKSCDERLLFGA